MGVRRLAAVVGLAAGLAGAAQAQAATTFQGAFVCDDGRPLAGARVELWQHRLTWLPKVPPNARQVGSMTADDNGGFAFRVGGSETNLFVRIVLSSADAEVRDWLAPWNWFADTSPNQNDVPVQNYGLQVVGGYQCRLWRAFRDAARDFATATGGRPPFGEIVVRAGAPNAGVPWTNYDTVWWPSGYAPVRNGISVAQHELAHAVRHVLDGSLAHWLVDVGRFVYPQNHSASSCRPTNLGFAFNEGWAEWWSGQVQAPCPGPQDLRVERNVAAALRAHQQACALSRGQMHAVLAANPGRIHAFSDFHRLSACPGATPPDDRLRRAVLDALSGRLAREREARKMASALRRAQQEAIRAAIAAADRARRARRAPLNCPARPCVQEAIRAIVELEARTRLAQLRARAEAMQAITDRRRIEQAARTQRTLRAALEAARARAARAEAKAAARGMQQALEALRRIRRAQQHAEIRAAIEALRAAQGSPAAAKQQALNPLPARPLKAGGPAAPPMAVTDLDPGSALAPEPPGPPPPPPPPQQQPQQPEPPAPAEKSSSTTTLDVGCHPEHEGHLWEPSNPDGSTTWRGQVLPAVAGTSVRMVYERSDAPTIVHTTTTDADGRFADTTTAQDYADGYADVWKVHAEFDGDATRLPSQSCVWSAIGRYP